MFKFIIYILFCAYGSIWNKHLGLMHRNSNYLFSTKQIGFLIWASSSNWMVSWTTYLLVKPYCSPPHKQNLLRYTQNVNAFTNTFFFLTK